jgi:hypothetical protein
MPQRKCNKTKDGKAKQGKRIVLPMSQEAYQILVEDRRLFRGWLDVMIEVYEELFPDDIRKGYWLYGSYGSKKMPEVRLQRIKLKAKDESGQAQVFTIAPSAVMPYMVGYTDDVEKALFLRRFGVPFWALAYVFGRDEKYWYRINEHIGRYDLVGSTIKDPDKLPKHVLADEKHTRLNGQKAYVAVTVGEDCVLGASFALKADEKNLKEAYGDFKEEAQRLQPDYQPETVNIDGWSATQLVWQALFPLAVVLQCFLHAFLKIRNCAKRLNAFSEIQQRVWDIYHADTLTDFFNQIGALFDWAHNTLIDHKKVLDAIDKLCAKSGEFALAFAHPGAYRTSNMIDRHMDPLDRCIYNAHYFHGHVMSAEYGVRAWALMHNFQPYCPRSKIRKRYQSPAHRLNGFLYHDNWLHNLLVSTSAQHVYRTLHKI